MPWQQTVADIAGEVLPDGSFAYDEIVITVPRQSGKTTLILPVVVGRAQAGAAFGGRQRMVYAAQTREDARDKWLSDYVEDIEAAPVMRGRFTKRIANGSERLTFTASRSTFGPIATGENSGHGKVLDLGVLDEAFAQRDSTIELAWKPAMITRPHGQMWIPSTAGSEASVYFKGKVDAARTAVEADAGIGTAYVEFSADPDQDDPADPMTWVRCMPALGFTQTLPKIYSRFTGMKLSDFKRAFLNIWVPKEDDQVLPADKWEATKHLDAKRLTRPVITIDISYDRSSACIAVGALTTDGHPMVRLQRYGPGTDWVVPAVVELRDRLDAPMVVFDAAGPVRSLKTELDNAYVEYHVTTAPEMVAACGGFYDAVIRGSLVTFGEPSLELAVRGASQRELGDGWAWTRKVSKREAGADICPLVAVTLAYWGQETFGDQEAYDWRKGFGGSVS
jgi:hypothetical protein